MKITDIVVHRLSVPLPRPVRTARHNHTHADTVAVEMRADSGLVGSGYCFAFGRRQAAALAALVEDFAELYRGRAAAPQARFAETWRSMHFIGHTGLALMALSPLDTACWDLAARAAGQPLFRYLGGDKTRVPTYASSGLWIDYSVDDLLREAEAFRAQGHRAMKMRIGRADPEEDIERVRIVRDALGGDAALLADVNQGWDEATAIRIGRLLAGRTIAVRGSRGLRAGGGRARHAHRHRRDGLRQSRHEAPSRGARGRRPDARSATNGRTKRVHAGGGALPGVAPAGVVASFQ
jgi:L-alanine-DL-glutamate epimerase-like enolase superfamily enzyme